MLLTEKQQERIIDLFKESQDNPAKLAAELCQLLVINFFDYDKEPDNTGYKTQLKEFTKVDHANMSTTQYLFTDENGVTHKAMNYRVILSFELPSKDVDEHRKYCPVFTTSTAYGICPASVQLTMLRDGLKESKCGPIVPATDPFYIPEGYTGFRPDPFLEELATEEKAYIQKVADKVQEIITFLRTLELKALVADKRLKKV